MPPGFCRRRSKRSPLASSLLVSSEKSHCPAMTYAFIAGGPFLSGNRCCAWTCSSLLLRSLSSNVSYKMRQRSCFKSVELTRLGLILLIPTALASSCLPDAVAPGQRQDLTNAAGESYPIGLVLGTWNSAYLTSAIFEILAEEVMGYNTRSLACLKSSIEMTRTGATKRDMCRFCA